MTAAVRRFVVGTGSASDPRIGIARTAWAALGAIAVGLAAAVAVAAGPGSAAGAQSSVAPVLSCPGSMVLDSGSGQCRTPRTETVLRPSSCPPGWTRVGGEFGGHECQRRVTNQVYTGRTRQVYSHTTYSNVWVPTGTERVQSGTNRTWVPARTMVEPLVPPLRVRTGTERRCDFDPVSGLQYNCRNVPVYGYQTTHTVTIPGYWREEPTYTQVETGYWDRVPTIHYTTEPVYETVVEWQSAPASAGSCGAGWQPAGNQCQRTMLGDPSAAPQQSCPSGTVPRYADAFGGMGPSVVSCQSSGPGSGTDTGTDQDTSGGPSETPDGTSRPLHHLAGESDERLAELGIHRCSDGLLSYVPCDELPGRTWDSDADACEGIEGTVYRPDHGGSCVTESDLLNKCLTPGDCEQTTIRTYCPAIVELSQTQIQEHVHPDRGAETYRVCVFDCADFGALPPYVQTRINGSYDYACQPVPDPVPTTVLTTSTTTTTAPIGEEETGGEDRQPGDTPDASDLPDSTGPDDNRPPGTQPVPDTTLPTTPDTGPDTTPDTGPERDCGASPPEEVAAATADELAWGSRVRASGTEMSPQQHMPGEGRHLQVAPGRGWMRVLGSLEFDDGDCRWVATWVRTTWSELRPWIPAELRRMQATAGTRHLATRWAALSEAQQMLLRQWHRPGAIPADIACTVTDASQLGATTTCGWLLRHPAAYAWQAQACFEPELVTDAVGTDVTQPGEDDECWVTLAADVDWIRSLSDYADSRVTVTSSGAGL